MRQFDGETHQEIRLLPPKPTVRAGTTAGET